jgi:ABC-type methionine transport system ATPase subunit
MGQNPSRQAHSRSASQKITSTPQNPNLLRNLMVYGNIVILTDHLNGEKNHCNIRAV